jgi:hypothetical protein
MYLLSSIIEDGGYLSSLFAIKKNRPFDEPSFLTIFVYLFC